jgi:hypothetical protein
MKRALVLLCLSSALSAVSTVDAQDFYPDFALVVQLPSYETFLTNLGDAPIRVDSYRITSVSGSLNPGGWASLDSAGPGIVDALGPEADQFDVVAALTPQHLMELNPVGSATWQPGQTWSIGFPFDSDNPDFVLDAVFQFSSPDGFTLSGGTVVPPLELAPAAFLVIPEPPTGMLCVLAAVGILALKAGACRANRSSSDAAAPSLRAGVRRYFMVR